MTNIPFSIQKTQEEIDAMSPAELKDYHEQQRLIVFGHDSHKDRQGHPIEQGLGAPGCETANHFQSILKYEGAAAHQAALAEIWKRDPKHAAKLGLPKPKPIEKAA